MVIKRKALHDSRTEKERNAGNPTMAHVLILQQY